MLYVDTLPLSPDDKQLLKRIVREAMNGTLEISIIRDGTTQKEFIETRSTRGESETIDQITAAFDKLSGEQNDFPKLAIRFEELELSADAIFRDFIRLQKMSPEDKELLVSLPTRGQAGVLRIAIDEMNFEEIFIDPSKSEDELSFLIQDALIAINDHLHDDEILRTLGQEPDHLKVIFTPTTLH